MKTQSIAGKRTVWLKRQTLMYFSLALLTFFPVQQFIGDTWAYSPEKTRRIKANQTSTGNRVTDADLADIAEKMRQNASDATIQNKKISVATNGAPIQIDNRDGVPFFIDSEGVSGLVNGMKKVAPGTPPEEIALEFIDTNKQLFKLENPRSELSLKDIATDTDGSSHVRFTQTYLGVPVDGQELVVHLDSSGAPYTFNGRYAPTPNNVDVEDIRVSSNDACAKSLTDLSTFTVVREIPESLRALMKYTGPTAVLCIRVDDESGAARLSWRVKIRTDERAQWLYFIDAITGEILEKYNTTAYETSVSASAVDDLGVMRTFNVALENGIYSMYDMEASLYTYDAKGKVITNFNRPSIVTSISNTWTDATAVSAHSNLRDVYDYYLDVHGRKGVDGNGGDLPAIVHYTEDGKPMDNAFWNGQFIAFGDGEPFAAALDVVGHELTHGVIEYTAGLEYKFQSGALNESIADVMATFIDPDWEIAEDLPSGPIRDISDPHRFDLPADMSEYQYYSIDEDYGGVHINMSIPARAAYITAEAIGKDKTADIWYHVLKNLYLTPKSQFVDMRLGAIRAAKDLYGEDSSEASSVANAFEQVGIVGDTPSSTPSDIPALEGENFIAFVYEEEGYASLAIASPDLTSSKDIIFPTQTPVTTDGSSPVTVCKGGAFLMFIDISGNIRKIDLETYDETLVDTSGLWSSIKLSPDGSKLAATTVNADSTIYMFDLVDPEKSKLISLYTPSTEGAETKTALYADALDWDRTGTQLIFDCFNILPVVGGSPVEFWDVNIVDVESGIISRVKTSTDHDTQIGNPSFAETNDRYIVCDRFSEELGTSAMVTIDLYTLDTVTLLNTGMINGNIPNLGHPKYSPDDSKILFQQYSFRYGADVLYTIPLQSDKMTAAGSAKTYYYGAMADWFVREEATDVSDKEMSSIPSAIALHSNYPNPFNPVTSIPFDLKNPGRVTLTVYDLLGREAARLIDAPMEAGNHSVAFDGSTLASGVYFYRLESGGQSITRKMTLVK